MRIRRATAADCAPMRAVHTRAIRHGCVDHVFTRQGVGRALVAALEDEAARGGARIVRDASLNAVRFCSAPDYAVEGDLRHPLGGGHAIGCKRMSKRLDAAVA